MLKNAKKLSLVALASGALFQFGCLGLNWTQLLWSTAVTSAIEFVLDNDAVVDLFEDGNVAAAN